MDGISFAPASGLMHANTVSTPAARQQAQEAPEQTLQLSPEQIVQASQELDQVANAFNRRMEFKYQLGLDTVVVKIVDRQTAKVFKELSPAELQRVLMRIREAIGLLVDEQA